MANIMIVDDSKTSRKILKTIFEEMGHTVVAEATDGESGYLMYKDINPDLVTLDITMPKMDGIEALMLIMKYNKDAKVIMVSAAGQKDKIMKAIKCGASEFISKPLDEEEIKKVVSGVLEAKR